ncbi:phosphoheptose isomerase [mine drainage metagenome]|uniref:D-sedoheptulose-7-phosphate isomerase n=1 Tax=mine drainage metagenome TaxID=410659 RepID=T1BUD9_9ZZZZ
MSTRQRSLSEEAIDRIFQDHQETFIESRRRLIPTLAAAGARLAQTLAHGNKILLCGNGGSAADAQHFAAELLNRFERERDPLPALALTTDSSTLTSIANDYAYEQVFAKQVQALGQKGDALIALSTSGRSTNVNAAVRVAQARGLVIVALTGRDGGPLAQLLQSTDFELRVPAASTARIQEIHILLLHALCHVIDASAPEP